MKNLQDELTSKIKQAKHLSVVLLSMDVNISLQIKAIERVLFSLDFDAFVSGDYTWGCRKGQWRFYETRSRRPVIDLSRDERANFLFDLKLPTDKRKHVI